MYAWNESIGVFRKNEVKTENIIIRVTSRQKMAIVGRARDLGVSVSEYILGVCGRDIEFNKAVPGRMIESDAGDD